MASAIKKLFTEEEIESLEDIFEDCYGLLLDIIDSDS
jgi:hypothetical protein